MIRAEARALIARPIDPVFAFVAVDFVRNYPRWSREVEVLEALSEGPIRVGWMGRQVRLDKGRRTRSRFRVVVFEQGRQVSFEGTEDPFRIDYRFDADGDRTRLVFSFELAGLSPALVPFGGMIRRMVQQSSERMMVRLKALIEDEVPGGLERT